MPQASYGVSLSVGGVAIQQSVTRSADSSIAHEVSLPVGSAGTVTTRTDNDTGILTVGSGHGILDTETVDVYWSGGMRYGCDVTAVTATTVAIDLGAGTNLPVTTTPIVVTKQVLINTAIDGDALEIIGLVAGALSQTSTAVGHLDMQDAASDSIAALDLTANQAVVYDIGAGVANPFTGDPITKVYASNGSSTEVLTLKILGLVDGTP